VFVSTASRFEPSGVLKMLQPEHFEMLIVGSGEGGKYLAWHMAKSGHRTAVVERRLIGGSCPNTNCLPSKNEIWSAKVADLVHHAGRFGTVTGPVVTDMKQVQARKRGMVENMIAKHLDLYKASGAELIMGSARFIAPKTIEVELNDGGTRVLTSIVWLLISARMRRSRTFRASRRPHLSPMSSCSNSIDCPST
jgi:pyruvate/2-oxoglutarate dehydrogenase complex dihydrolipoamide dehydrogenase (E3) component